jgi:uncharacterized protein (DUF2141 family)
LGGNNVKKWLFPLFLLFALVMLPALAQAARLSILLQDYRHPGVSAYIAIYAANDRGSWGDEPLQLLQSSLVEGDNMLLAADLPPGRYALRAFVDLNGNGELDTSTLGKPTEPFALSRLKGAADSLRFKAATVDVVDKGELVLRFLHPKRGDRANTEKKYLH